MVHYFYISSIFNQDNTELNILSYIYVDDIIDNADLYEEVLKITNDIEKVLKKASFKVK